MKCYVLITDLMTCVGLHGMYMLERFVHNLRTDKLNLSSLFSVS
jgi:hypothetical protein